MLKPMKPMLSLSYLRQQQLVTLHFQFFAQGFEERATLFDLRESGFCPCLSRFRVAFMKQTRHGVSVSGKNMRALTAARRHACAA